MSVRLPTDTQHLNVEARQYELFGYRLGQGVPYRVVWPTVAAFAVWLPLMWLVGLFSAGSVVLACFLSIVPPLIAIMASTRIDDSGRMAGVRAWDRLLALRAARRRPIRNPLLTGADADRAEVAFVYGLTEIRPGSDATPIKAVWTRTSKGN